MIQLTYQTETYNFFKDTKKKTFIICPKGVNPELANNYQTPKMALEMSLYPELDPKECFARLDYTEYLAVRRGFNLGDVVYNRILRKNVTIIRPNTMRISEMGDKHCMLGAVGECPDAYIKINQTKADIDKVGEKLMSYLKKLDPIEYGACSLVSYSLLPKAGSFLVVISEQDKHLKYSNRTVGVNALNLVEFIVNGNLVMS